MLFEFCNYLYNIKNNNIYDYFNCYSTFIMTKKDLKENVLNHRMKFLINYYVQDKNLNNITVLRNYYIKNYKDDYLNKPLISSVQEFKDIDNEEKRDDDVEEHYKYMLCVPPPEPIINYDELDKKYYEEQKNAEIYISDYDDDYDYDYDYENELIYGDIDEDDDNDDDFENK